MPLTRVQGTESLGERYDLAFIACAVALLALGLVMVVSASTSIAARTHGDPLYYLWRQGAFLAVGGLAGWATTRVPVAVWHRAGPLLLVASAVLLAAVLVPGVGREVNGSMRWFRVGPISVQPSELVKLAVAAYLAGYLVRRAEEVRRSFSGFLKPVTLLVIISVLLLLEPDYGATVVLFVTALGMLFLGGVPFLTFAAWAGIIAGALAVVVVAAPYRVERLLSFLDPWADPFGSGFQLTQALIAIGRGEWLGVGLGESVQKLFYLPEAHTDFLFAVLAEELGLVGAVGVIGLFTFLVVRAMGIGRHAESVGQHYSAYLAYGLALLFGLQAFVNIGVNLGILPTKGLTLPLMSYGGSSLITNCIAVGLLVRIDHEARMRG
ncbi:MAG: putative lipid II flippase FtsW [Ectothiorhodospiraceae bacterium]|nr:putative lipid II flippase FtsW [Chromatiales bacterium]MCP5153924.1 putative lipid II flippase FtsW [Ectothiorhodospiraceae bacterium]